MAKKIAEEFINTMVNNPNELVEWAEREIAEYQRFIKILKKQVNFKLKK